MALTCTNVTLRQRVISNGRISLYLDYYPAIRNPYTMKMSRREYLGIYIYARPKNEIERDFNNEMLSKAEAIRCIRVQAIVNEEFGFLDNLTSCCCSDYVSLSDTEEQRQCLGCCNQEDTCADDHHNLLLEILLISRNILIVSIN